MKQIKRIMIVVLVLVLAVSLSLTAFAATASQDGLELLVTTDKTSYSATEQVTVTVTVKNTNAFAVSNVAVESNVPDGYKPADGYSSTKNIAALGAGETTTLTVVYVPQNSGQPSGSNYPQFPWWAPGVLPGTTTNPSPSSDETEDVKDVVEVDQPTEGNTNVFEEVTVTAKRNVGLWVLVAAVSAGALIGIVAGKKRFKKTMSIMLCIAMVGTLAAVLPVEAHAAVMPLEAGGVKSLSTSEEITISGRAVSVVANVSWTENLPQDMLIVRFDSNGGNAIEPLLVATGEKAVWPSSPKKDGCTFDGWYTDEALSNLYDFNNVLYENITLYAKWIDAKEYYGNNSELIEIIPAEESENALNESEVTQLLLNKGFNESPITYDFSITGDYVGKTEISEGSTDIHPMYQTLYLSKNEEVWVIYVINNSVFAYPFSFNMDSNLSVEMLISESENVTSYDDATNQFYITVPHSSEIYIHTVGDINAETLDGLTIEILCNLSGATIPVSSVANYSYDEMNSLIAVPYAIETDDISTRYSSADPLIIVSLGDSYSSGEGIEKFYGQDKPLTEKVRDDNWLAHRSQKSWPGLLEVPGIEGTMSDYMVPLGTTSTSSCQWYFAASSGATTYHFNNSQKKSYYRSTGLFSSPVKGEKYLPPQLDAFNGLRGKVDYVTFSIGGNDVGFTDVITACAVNCAYLYVGSTSKLEDLLNEAWANFNATRANIKKAYMDVRDKAGEQADIIVAGYPQLLEPNGKGALFNKRESTMVNNNVSRFNDEIEYIVEECKISGMKIHFVDVENEFLGHAAYSDHSWLNKIKILKEEQDIDSRLNGASAYSMHPNAQGAKAYARCVNAKIAEIENSKTTQLSSIKGVITIADTDTDMNNNLPLEGATVTIEYADFMDFTSTSDADGQYHISDIPAGTYRLTVTKDGYIPVTERIVIPDDGSEVIYNVAIEAISEGYSGIGYASGTVYDVSTGLGVSGLTLNIYHGIGVTSGDIAYTTYTTNGGYYETQNGLEAGNYTVVVLDERNDISEESRYVTTNFSIKVLGGMTIDNQNGYVSNGITSDNIRIVLSWGASPSDLDSHLVGPTSIGGTFHVYYSNKSYGDEVDLDRDDTDSYGPETVTIRRINDGVYTYAVHNYSDRGSSYSTSLSSSGAQVKVYRGAELVMTYNVPTGTDGTLWTVFSYDTNTQRFTTINTMSYDNSDGDGVLQGIARTALNQVDETSIVWFAQDMIISDINANTK